MKQIWQNYKLEAIKTMQALSKEEMFNYASLKLISEIGEVVGELTKQKYHPTLTNELKVQNELGDVMFYLNLLDIVFDNPLQATYYETQGAEVKNSNNVITLLLWSIDSACGFIHGNLDNRDMQVQKLHCIFEMVLDIIDKLDFKLEEILSLNIAKIRKRHGETYNGKNFYCEENIMKKVQEM